MDLQEPTSLKGLFQGMIPESMGMVKGRVTATAPLEIRVINDDKLALNKNLLCVPRHLTDYTTTCDIELSGTHSHPDAASGGAHAHTQVKIKMYNALKLGEIVYLLSFNGGKKYYVLDREGGT